jgi:hypothetical protein
VSSLTGLCCVSASLLLAADPVEPLNLAQPSLPTPQAGAAIPGGSDSYQAGWADRLHWEDWFGRQAGEARAGALWWSTERSKPVRNACEGSPTFVSGCLDAKAILTPTDSRRHREPDYRSGWNSYAPGQTAPPAPGGAAPDPDRLAPHDDVATWNDGLHDRTAWEDWFAALAGDRRAGALYWSGERSKPNPGGCDGGTTDFVAGCQEARQRLAQSDRRRRHAEAVYRHGWNSYALSPAPAPPAAASEPQDDHAAPVAAQCADFGTLGRLCTGQNEAAVIAAFGPPVARSVHRCAVGTPQEADCHAWFYAHDCGRYTILFEQAGSGEWRITSAGFTQAPDAADTGQRCDAHG